ncbi:MAG: TetR/AcrR family transcriptional regulator [Nocardiopsaceae bacterium]|nr:TetR/AcrR family transcriptional regulator [Nocardiopsaceae bacterium]
MTDSADSARHPEPSDPPPPDTRSAILDATQAEVARQGYEAMSVRSIARQAQVDPRLIRYYFSGKKTLVLAALDRFGAIRASAGGSLLEATVDAVEESWRGSSRGAPASREASALPETSASWEFVTACALSGEPSVRDAAAALIESALDGLAPDDPVPDGPAQGGPAQGGLTADDGARPRALLLLGLLAGGSLLLGGPWAGGGALAGGPFTGGDPAGGGDLAGYADSGADAGARRARDALIAEVRRGLRAISERPR